jgi:hypothetical protein
MANNSSDELNMQGVLGSPRHISGDKSTTERAAPPTERAACLQFGGIHAQRWEGKHPSFASCFHDEQPLGQCDELPAQVTVLWRPALDRPRLEGKCQYWRIALVETAQFFRIVRG